VAALAVFAAVTVVKPVLAQHERAQAQSLVSRKPIEALRRANRSLALDPTALPTYYAKAAAYARLGDYADARATLLAALHREPHAFVTWVLIGDLATRRGDRATARRAYRRAIQLNPQDTTLRRLVA
jgi:tetratricopeptide (TPR) repeat protein